MKRFRLLVALFVMLPWAQIAFGVDPSTKKQAESNPTQFGSTPTAQEWKLLNGRLDDKCLEGRYLHQSKKEWVSKPLLTVGSSPITNWMSSQRLSRPLILVWTRPG